MNYPSLALGLVFAAIAMPFFGQARKSADPTQRRNKRLAGAMFLVASAGFLLAFAVSAVR